MQVAPRSQSMKTRSISACWVVIDLEKDLSKVPNSLHQTKAPLDFLSDPKWSSQSPFLAYQWHGIRIFFYLSMVFI